MSKSNLLRLREIRQVYNLINRISEFGDRPDIWQRIALEGLVAILGGNIGFTLDIRLTPDGSPQLIDPIDTGWQTDSARERFVQYANTPEMARDPGTIAVLQAQRKHRFITYTRRELVDDATWYGSPCVSEARHICDVDDFIIISSAIDAAASHGLIVYRPWKDPPFQTRHKRIMRLFGLELLRAIRDNQDPQPIFGSFPPLSPRLRQTLDLLLTPMSVKEIAAQLQLSRHTVAEYQKSIYRLFKVNSRPELMCQFRPIKRPIRLPPGLA